jgi:carbonic anhydrase
MMTWQANLFSGNKRYATGNGGALQTMDEALMKQLDTAGQNPVAIILGCADSRAPIEILFDVRPGDLFVLRNAGNTCGAGKGSVIGSAEYAIGNLNTKLFCVTGHTKCGALTAAVQTAIANVDTSTVAGSIGIVLDDIMDSAKEAIAILPDSPQVRVPAPPIPSISSPSPSLHSPQADQIAFAISSPLIPSHLSLPSPQADQIALTPTLTLTPTLPAGRPDRPRHQAQHLRHDEEARRVLADGQGRHCQGRPLALRRVLRHLHGRRRVAR